MSYLSMAGFKVNETISAMPGVLNLAAASQESLGTSADIVSNILSGFSMSADEADHAVDVLVKTMTTANTNLPQLGDAMKYVAPIATSLGIPIEQVAAAVGKMSDAGIQGSQAGTSLRAALLSLANPTGQTIKAMEALGIEVVGADGAMKPLPELIGHIEDKLGGMEEAQKTATVAQLVGSEAASGFLALLEIGEDGLASYTTELETSAGAADKMAKIQQDTVNGAFKEFQSALEEVGIKIGNEFLPAFRDIIEVGTDVMRFIGELDADLIKQGLTFAAVTSGVALLITTLGKLVIAMRVAMVGLGPAGWAVLGLSALAGILVVASEEASKLSEVNLDVADSMAESNLAVRDSLGAYEELRAKSKLTNDEFGRFLDIQSELATAVDDSKIAELTEEQNALIEKSGLSNEELSKMVGLNGELIAAVPEAAGAITEQGNRVVETTDKIRDYNKELEGATLRELERQRIIAEGNEVEIKKELKTLQAELNEGYAQEEEFKREFANFDEAASQAKIEQIELELERGDLSLREEGALKGNLRLEKEKITTYRDQLTSIMEANDEKRATIDELNKELGLVGEIDQRMIEVLMTQQGINFEKGNEIQAIDEAIAALGVEKKALEDKTPVNIRNTDEYLAQVAALDAQINGLGDTRNGVIQVYTSSRELTSDLNEQNRQIDEKISGLNKERSELEKNTAAADKNTDEYRNGVKAINDQIAELQGVKSQIGEAIKAGNTLNTTLGKGITKRVNIVATGRSDLAGNGPMPLSSYHTGGLVGKAPLNQLPTLHTRGTAASLADRFKQPMQHEQDVRLLRNEMVLTESQQANLMRMIDAGHTQGGAGQSFDPAIAALLGQIAQNTAAGKSVNVTLSSDAVYESTQDKMYNEISTKKFMRGLRVDD